MSISYRDYKVILAAGVAQDITVPGDYWQLIETPGGPILLELEEIVRLTREAGMGGPGNYSYVRLTSPVAQSIVIGLGFTNGLAPYDSRSPAVQALLAQPETVSGLDDAIIAAGATANFPANVLRDTILLTLDDAAPDFVRVASQGAAKGARLYPGGSISIRAKGAVTVRNPNGIAVTVSASETLLP